jgi:hypothetical protein
VVHQTATKLMEFALLLVKSYYLWKENMVLLEVQEGEVSLSGGQV